MSGKAPCAVIAVLGLPHPPISERSPGAMTKDGDVIQVEIPVVVLVVTQACLNVLRIKFLANRIR